jgi:formylglycine-generating enzyme required for sulfatase activity
MQVKRGRFCAALVVGLATAVAPFVRADNQSDGFEARRTEFAAWQKAHPDVAAQLAGLKTKTAALVAAAGTPTTDISAPPAIRRVPGAITELWDDPVAPELVIVPAGSYTMGSPASERGRVGNEGPQHRVTLNTPLAVGKYPVTRDEFAAFVGETRRPDGAFCSVPGNVGFTLGGGFGQVPGNWRNPGFPQTGRDPVVCVSWSDAQAYVTWLSAKTGRTYRLLTESEWEYAARAGTMTARYWGEAANPEMANYGAEPAGGVAAGLATGADRWVYTSPVGSFPANPFGLYDMVGNVSQWVQDCYQPTYAAPQTGAALECAARLTRGANWSNPASLTRVAYRNAATWNVYRASNAGIRVARAL